MRSSSEAFDYTPFLPQKAPEYLREWAERREWLQNALIWKIGSYYEPLTELRHKCAEAVCTACGQKMLLDYEPGDACCGIRYPPQLRIDLKKLTERELVRCPECGAEVCVRHVHGSDYGQESAWPITLDRIEVRGKTDRAVLILWHCYKTFNSSGDRKITIRPWEAYVLEEKKLIRCTKHSGSFYATIYRPFWRQTKYLKDTMMDIVDVVCPEGVERALAGTTAENAKLEIYLRDAGITFPVAWLRLLLRHPNAETLMTAAPGIISNLIGQEQRDSNTDYRRAYSWAAPKLDALNWKARRPSEILRMDRGELREAVKQHDKENIGGASWKLWLAARKAGHDWSLAELPAIEQLKRRDRLQESPDLPSKIVGYLNTQRRRWPKDNVTEETFHDYRRLARRYDLDLTDKEIRWPERLLREHDRLVARQQAEKDEAERKKFARTNELVMIRAEALRALEYHSRGLLIRPAGSRDELIAEGKALHHCVGDYAQSVAEGKTAIFFIRREEEPDKSYYTLELNEKSMSVLQNRGSRNCNRTEEVAAFEAEWLEWLRGLKKNREVKTA